MLMHFLMKKQVLSIDEEWCLKVADIEAAPTIEQPQWISVDEKLPQEDEPLGNLCKIVQVLLKDGTVTVGFCNRSLQAWAHIAADDMYFTGKSYAETPVAAWKPLSQPPKGDEW